MRIVLRAVVELRDFGKDVRVLGKAIASIARFASMVDYVRDGVAKSDSEWLRRSGKAIRNSSSF